MNGVRVTLYTTGCIALLIAAVCGSIAAGGWLFVEMCRACLGLVGLAG